VRRRGFSVDCCSLDLIFGGQILITTLAASTSTTTTTTTSMDMPVTMAMTSHFNDLND
jgi:hypothetical protein